jgi:diguanylate cyclase (GGDEF)-like protein
MHRQTRALTDRLRVLVETDPLTGVGNRRQFMKRLGAEFGRAERAQRPLGLLVVDIDRFKAVNDSYGHQVGDAVLVAVARILVTAGRKYDTIARIGGEEFAIILPEVDTTRAIAVAERMRKRVEEAAGTPALASVTISIGVAHGPLSDKDDAEALMRRADENLYAAKAAGRNRVHPLAGSGGT